MTQLSIFPKFLSHLSAAELGQVCADCRLDAVNAVVREGYWTPADRLAATLPSFVASIRASGLQCNFATWADPPEGFLARGEALRQLVAVGIGGVRIGYFKQQSEESYRQAIERARRVLDELQELAALIGIRLVLQVHHGRLVSGPEGAAWLLDGYDPRHLSVMLDVGNQAFEGCCDYRRADHILAERWTHLGVKDTSPLVAGREFVPCQSGCQDWPAIARAWRLRARPGAWVLQPFYAAERPDEHQRLLKEEVSYLRSILQQAQDATAAP